MRRALECCGVAMLLVVCGCGKSGADSADPSATANPGAWKTFDPEQGKFTIKLPGDPLPQPDDGTASKGWSLNAGNLSYSIRYSELANPEIAQNQNKIDESFDNFADTLRITEQVEVQEVKKQINFAGVSGWEIDGTTSAKKLIRIRLGIVENRRYRADVTGSKDAIGSPDAEVFFDSLKIAK